MQIGSMEINGNTQKNDIFYQHRPQTLVRKLYSKTQAKSARRGQEAKANKSTAKTDKGGREQTKSGQ